MSGLPMCGYPVDELPGDRGCGHENCPRHRQTDREPAHASHDVDCSCGACRREAAR